MLGGALPTVVQEGWENKFRAISSYHCPAMDISHFSILLGTTYTGSAVKSFWGTFPSISLRVREKAIHREL